MSQKFLIKQIIKNILLNEAAIDVWKNKNKSLTQQQISQAEKYFAELTAKYNAALHPTVKNLTELSFEELETLYKTVAIAKEKNLKSVYAQWLTKKLKENNLTLQQIIEDYIPPLLSLQKNKEKFDPNFLNDLESIEDLNKELNVKISSEEMAVPDEQFGKLAEENGWILYMPHSTEASCEIGKTGGRRDTTWCTTRTNGENLFLDYVARPDADIILFYVVKKGVNAEKDPFAKMSVGFINGQPKFNKGNGNISVNAQNQNLTQEKFEEVLGKELADRFIQIMKQEANKYQGGKHPSKEEIKRIAKNVKLFKDKFESYADNENGRYARSEFLTFFLSYPTEISTDILLFLASHKDRGVRIAVVNYEKTPPEILKNLATDPDGDVCKFVAQNPKTPPETLAYLAKDPDKYVRQVVAHNPNTPPETLAYLAKDPDGDVRQVVAENPNTPQEILKTLATDPNKNVRKFIAQNLKTPPETLAYLAKDPDKNVRRTVASNPNTPQEILKTLAEDDNVNVRIGVASNPNTPPEGLKTLTTDPDSGVRQVVAHNPNTPPEILKTLATDPDRGVRERLLYNPNTTSEILKILYDNDYEIRIRIAENENTSLEVLVQLAKDTNPYVRQAVARRDEKLPEFLELLQVLAKDPDEKVRAGVAGNDKIPLELLAYLAKDPDRGVRQVVAIKNTLPEVLADLATDPEVDVRKFVASNPNTPQEILKTLATDPEGDVREGLLYNPNIPIEVLEYLAAKDPDYSTRNRAEEQLEALKAQQLTEAIIFQKVFSKLVKKLYLTS